MRSAAYIICMYVPMLVHIVSYPWDMRYLICCRHHHDDWFEMRCCGDLRPESKSIINLNRQPVSSFIQKPPPHVKSAHHNNPQQHASRRVSARSVHECHHHTRSIINQSRIHWVTSTTKSQPHSAHSSHNYADDERATKAMVSLLSLSLSMVEVWSRDVRT